MKFEEIWPRGFRREVVRKCERMDGRTFLREVHYEVIPLIFL